ncbi:MAG: glycosyltransferase family 4 protein [Candidatus Sungbacteria bacterium]|nr:glycosyltransferase family 4 protein [Candidatus Sungbacteria bacterium]
MRVALICPFNIDRVSGTPTRTRLNIKVISQFAEVNAYATGGVFSNTFVISDKLRFGRIVPGARLGKFSFGVARNLFSSKPDAVHAVTTAAVLPAALYKLLHPRTRFIFEIHGLSFYEARNLSYILRLFFRVLDWIGTRLADALIVMSHTQRKFLCSHMGVNPQKIFISWGPVDMDFYTYRDPPIPPPFCVGYLGNDSFWQGLPLILEAAKILQSEKNIRFVLGGFEKKPDIGAVADNIELKGIVPRGAEPVFFSQCHVLLSPRIRSEVSDTQYPYKLSYYLASGRPVIASDTSDQRLILEKAGCGLVFTDYTAQALVDAVRKIFRSAEFERRTMGKNAHKFAQENFSLEVFEKKLKEIYRV